MRVTIAPSPLNGVVRAIPSKACAHRALIAAALAGNPAALRDTGASEDVLATRRCLRALAETLGAGVAPDAPVRGLAGMAVDPSRIARLDCGESGSTLRFLVPVAAALGITAELRGRGRLPSRPMDALLGQLAAHGVTTGGRGLSPLRISGRLEAGVYALPGDVSSQYVTGLLLALPLLGGDSEIRLTGPLESAGYVDMTLATLDAFSVRADRTNGGFRVPGGQSYVAPADAVAIEGDWSAAAFWLAAGALGSNVAVRGLTLPSHQGDRAILAILASLGAAAHYDDGRAAVFRGNLSGRRADVSQCPDLAPALAVVAAYAEGTTRLENAGRLRLKESDRLAAMAGIVRGLGAACETIGGDALAIRGTGGKPFRGGRFDSRGDHRVAMALAVAATVADGPVVIDNAGAVAKSDPGFWDTYDSLRLSPVARDYDAPTEGA